MSEKDLQKDPILDELLDDPFGDFTLETKETNNALQPSTEKDVDNPFEDTQPKPKKSLIHFLKKVRKAMQLASQIDPKNQQSISLYGTQAQSKLINFPPPCLTA